MNHIQIIGPIQDPDLHASERYLIKVPARSFHKNSLTMADKFTDFAEGILTFCIQNLLLSNIVTCTYEDITKRVLWIFTSTRTMYYLHCHTDIVLAHASILEQRICKIIQSQPGITFENLIRQLLETWIAEGDTVVNIGKYLAIDMLQQQKNNWYLIQFKKKLFVNKVFVEVLPSYNIQPINTIVTSILTELEENSRFYMFSAAFKAFANHFIGQKNSNEDV